MPRRASPAAGRSARAPAPPPRDAGRGDPAGEPLDAVDQLGVGDPLVAVHERRGARMRPGALVQQVDQHGTPRLRSRKTSIARRFWKFAGTSSSTPTFTP